MTRTKKELLQRKGYFQALFYVRYTAIKTQSLTEFCKCIFQRLVILTLVMKQKRVNTLKGTLMQI